MIEWNAEKVQQLYALGFMELLFQAQTLHRQHFAEYEMELCSLINIKTGGCPEDCGYCSQSAHYKTNLTREKLFDKATVLAFAKEAQQKGAKRVCLGAAWRSPPKKDFPAVLDIIRAIKKMGLETCVTLGMLNAEQAAELKAAGLDFYNHNLDTSPTYYEKVVSTRTYQDRLETLQHVSEANLRVCCGGILGMGESRADRIALLIQLTQLPKPPESVPINRLVPIPGTPLANTEGIDHFEFIRTIAVTRIMLPQAVIRLSAGRYEMAEETQTLCFLAGANSMWLGDKLLTTKNGDYNADLLMLKKLGIKIKAH